MDRELKTLKEVMLSAGAEALHLAKAGFETHTKSDHSPVTTADLAVNGLLQSRLAEEFPEDGWLSEESQDNPDRLSKRRVWIVDPIDGTRAYVRGDPEFCISVALVEQNRPILSAIYNPARGEWFSAIHRRGLTVERLSRPSVGQFEPGERPLVLVNPWDLRSGRLRQLELQVRCQPIGSIAYGLALVAAGLADAALMLDGGNEWDIVAGILLVCEGGGRATSASGQWPSFNQPDTRQRGTLALAATVPPPLLDLLMTTAAAGR